MKRQLYSGFLFPLLLVALGIVIAIQNTTPGTMLLGWDSLHPEFNFPLAFTRAFTGVWRTDQGLGAVAAHSHMADLPHIILLAFMSIALPSNYLRYAFFFLSFTTGTLGVFYLVKTVLKSRAHTEIVALFSALVYAANYGTLQHFSVPFEMFAVEYALLPWILLTTLQYLNQPNRKHFVWFCVTILLAAPMAYAATLWYAFFGCFVLFTIIAAGIKRWKHAVILIAAPILLNIYWIAPNVYFSLGHGQEVTQSKINQLFSPEAFAKNQLFGTIENAAVLKNFLFDWQLYSFPNKQFEPVLKPWIDNANIISASVGYIVFFLVLFGIAHALWKKEKAVLSFIPIFVIPLLFLLNGTWPMTAVFDELGKVSLVVYEALRFPFTKFSILFMLALSVYAGYGVGILMDSIKGTKKFRLILPISLSFLLLIYFKPALEGNLIQPAMRVAIPKAYTDMFRWFDGQNHDDRVSILPIHTFWNWTYNNWGYQGAGFLQFGIPQPILDRDYDRWSPYNEQYQREMTYAVYSQNPEYFRQVLTKYNIKWILFDRSVVSPGENDNITLDWLIPSLIEATGLARVSQQFGNDITVYEVTSPTSDVALYNNLTDVTPTMIGAPYDWTYDYIGPYLTDNSTSHWNDPYRGMFGRSERFLGTIDGNPVATISAETREFFDKPVVPCAGIGGIYYGTTTVNNDSVHYESKDGPHCDYFPFPNLDHDKNYVVEITSRNLSGFPLQVCISNNLTRHCDVTIHLRKSPEFVTEKVLLPRLFDFGTGYSLNVNNFAIRGIESINEIKSIIVKELPWDSDIQTAYQPLQSDLHTPVEVTRIITSHPNSAYYKFEIDNSTSANNATLVLNQSFEKGWKAYEIETCDNNETRDMKQGTWQKILSPVSCLLSRSLPFLFGREIKNHVLVNNWSNGWRLQDRTLGRGEEGKNNSVSSDPPFAQSSQRTIVLFFLPQLLQWLGFALLPIPFVWTLSKRS